MNKNIKVVLFGWVFMIGLSVLLSISNGAMSDWETWLILAMLIATAILNTRGEIRNYKRFFLKGDTLTVQEAFSKEKRYRLKNMQSWTRYQYGQAGFITGQQLLLKQPDGRRISLLDNKDNSIEFEKLSSYLNTHLSRINEN